MGGFGSWNKKALEEINKFRIQEGKALIKDICHRIELIQELSAQVPQFEVKRVEVIRQKLQEKSMNGRIFKISMKTGWNRKLSTTWKIGYHRRESQVGQSL